METDFAVFKEAVVEGCWTPGIGEEDHRYGLAEVVELQSGGADCAHDGGVGDAAGGDVEGAGAEGEVRVCGCSIVLIYLLA